MSYLSDLVASTRRRLEEARAAISDDVLEQRIASQDAPGRSKRPCGPSGPR